MREIFSSTREMRVLPKKVANQDKAEGILTDEEKLANAEAEMFRLFAKVQQTLDSLLRRNH